MQPRTIGKTSSLWMTTALIILHVYWYKAFFNFWIPFQTLYLPHSGKTFTNSNASKSSKISIYATNAPLLHGQINKQCDQSLSKEGHGQYWMAAEINIVFESFNNQANNLYTIKVHPNFNREREGWGN